MKYLKFVLPLIGFLFALNSEAQVGKEFPSVSGETLTEEAVTLPKDISKKFTLIGMAWSKKGEDDLEDWLLPVYELFLDKDAFIAIDYDLSVYFMPMFSGFKKGAHKSVMADAKKHLDKKLHPHMLFYKGKVKEYKKELNFDDRTIPYFFVLDEKGKIVYATSGKYKEEKLDEIEKLVSK